MKLQLLLLYRKVSKILERSAIGNFFPDFFAKTMVPVRCIGEADSSMSRQELRICTSNIWSFYHPHERSVVSMLLPGISTYICTCSQSLDLKEGKVIDRSKCARYLVLII